jgi:CheY-like chemotaxis protein
MFLRGNKKQQKNRIEQLEIEIDRLNQLLAVSKKDVSLDPVFALKVFELSGIGYWIKPMDDEQISLSPVAREILNIKGKNTITFREFLDCVHPDDAPFVEKQLISIVTDSKPVEIEYRILVAENENREIRYCYSKATILTHPGLKSAFLICIINKNVYIEKIRKDLARAIEKAEEAEHSKYTLLANISHEIRTPLNTIIGFSELLNIGKLDVEKRKGYVKTIRNQGTMLLKFIDDITELIKFESGKVKIAKTRCNLNILLKELQLNIGQQQKSLNKESLDIKLIMPDKNGLSVFTDPGRLQQVIANLINNSIKYTEKGFIEYGYRLPSEGKIEFFVKDTGIGLTKDQQRNIFNRFSDEEMMMKKYEGSGLGLSLSKHLVKLLGGKIWVESELGKGAIFQFTIPFEQAYPENSDYISVEEEEMPKFNWKDKVILIVEDDEINFKFLEAILQDSEAHILQARNGFQAVELCRSISKIDLILMDIKMPEMDGFEATRQIRLFNKKIPVIAQTAYILEIDQDKCFEAGCNEIVTKPIDIKEFLEKANSFLRE